MNVDEHARNIGGLICNLQTIEFQIRSTLAWANYPEASGIPPGHKLADFTVGSKYVAGAFTDYATLGKLIAAFDAVAERRALKKLPAGLVELRNALAHGRCIADPGDPYFRLLKFSPVQDGHVTVTYNAVLDPNWYDQQRRLLTDALWVLEAARQQP